MKVDDSTSAVALCRLAPRRYGLLRHLIAGIVTHQPSVLHDFKVMDGVCPVEDLVYANGILYGTTFGGGKHKAGTVFEVMPPP
jgi:uncharacterized repeat protein (TIGR03803 family)